MYIQRDRGFTADLVARAETAGARGIVLTVDTPSLGARDRDRRDSFGLDQGTAYPILADAQSAVEYLPPHRRIYNPLLAPDITWDHSDGHSTLEETRSES